MLVKLTTGMVSAEKTYEAGDIVSLPDDEAFRYLQSEMATPVAETEQREQQTHNEPKRENRRNKKCQAQDNQGDSVS